MKALVSCLIPLLLISCAAPIIQADPVPIVGPDIVTSLPADIDTSAPHKVAHIVFHHEVNSNTVFALTTYLSMAASLGVEGIVLDLTTPGGETEAGHDLAVAIEASPVPVVCVADHQVASMGFYILQSCAVRVMTTRTLLMAHKPSVTLNFSGDVDDIANLLERVSAVTETIAQQYCHRLNIKYTDCRNNFDHKEWWLTAGEALKVGAVDLVIENPTDFLKHLRYD
ncbi:ClpP Protease subunit of ATP-dependent Clp proteases [uncultured Caudovirales phage]|uniref:ClpP Protease subunit of ATP-dependent Clp proteases n=1 Tax=uncultured Caudovirales phage TaxID=2100421 RepID=A0A6J5L1F2_9CAUD|nr:ClpP Protease subunit of ATP-dependent Clp proteases [uncultured Caudovirales phage]